MSDDLRVIRRRGWCVAVAFAASVAGCATMEGTVRERAATEYRCHPDRVTVEDLGGNGFRANACGREAMYVCERQRSYWSASGSEVTCRREVREASAGSP